MVEAGDAFAEGFVLAINDHHIPLGAREGLAVAGAGKVMWLVKVERNMVQRGLMSYASRHQCSLNSIKPSLIIFDSSDLATLAGIPQGRTTRSPFKDTTPREQPISRINRGKAPPWNILGERGMARLREIT